ncbi:2-oxoglutarate (2OG) and Fe(II)-dependent oxygenase superfamily protein isoform 3 [Theobroma cacao]|uniref:2-oxoglutarate (2OG) and Fe(II)-dependent oxygenase superfamily protein isoform 3 n=1 Tax=Theobroma cacao TaxID=3641 RepID=A0A061DT50_THECC|nr:2-oxoglutarate (2OG) and Fe(II)-dependent oxygenase superfamily protein isoform 3 [Theobroma cacao]
MATTIKPLLTDLVSTVSSVPPNYVRPESDRPKLNEVTFDHSIPLLDLQGLHGPNHSSVIKEIGEACQNYGFFQEFFHLPESERLKNYSDDPMKTTRLSTSFNGKHAQHMAINCYPPCPEPELTYGLPAHADPNVITILLQADVPGLQVLKDGKWTAVSPVPYTFIVNIGDQIQVVSNDRYKSVLHRAVVNCKEERISIPTFYCPSPDAVMRPAPQLIDDDHPPLYRSYSYSEYYQKFWKRGLNAETCLDMFKI